MLFRSDATRRLLGWLLALVGLAASAAGGSGYVSGGSVRPGWVLGGLAGVVAGTALVRWARRADPDR